MDTRKRMAAKSCVRGLPNFIRAREPRTCGGSEANFICTWALLERGDEVVFTMPNYMHMAEDLLYKKGVLIAPGEQLGMSSHLRFGYGGDVEHLKRALARFDEYLGESSRAHAARAEQAR